MTTGHALSRMLREGGARWGDRVAVVDPALGREVTYAGLDRLVDAASARLLGRVSAPGEVVAVLARNGLEQAVAVLACSRAGLVHLGLPVDLAPDRLREVMAVAAPRLLLVQPDLRDTAGRAVTGLDPAPLLLDAGDELCSPGGAGSPPPPPVEVPGAEDPDRTYALICTSGSTGHAKLVRLTGTMTGTAARTYGALLGLGPQDRTAVHLPMWWVSGHVTQLASSLASGGAVVTMARWSPAALLGSVVEHGVTWWDLVPTLWHGLLRQEGFDGERLPGLRAVVFGGSPASAEVLADVRRQVPGVLLLDAYAMSEVPAPITCLLDAEAALHPRSVGRAQPHGQLRVLRADGSPAQAGEQGAVAVLTPALTPGYVSADRLAVDDDGWFRTGDLGTLDDEGFLTITGRAADALVRGGVTIHPAEVERAMVASGLVAAALVVALPSRLSGDAVAAVVVAAREGPPVGSVERRSVQGQVDVAALRSAVRAAVGAHAVPVRVLVVAALPRTGNDKPDRAAARALLDRAR